MRSLSSDRRDQKTHAEKSKKSSAATAETNPKITQ
jgi:hypothetical protein